MAILRQIKRLQFIDFVIRRRATGSLESFAKKNGLSKRGITIILQEMKEMGFPIKYSRLVNSYYYEEEGEMVKCLFLKKEQILSREEIRELTEANPSNICFSEMKIFEVCTSS